MCFPGIVAARKYLGEELFLGGAKRLSRRGALFLSGLRRETMNRRGGCSDGSEVADREKSREIWRESESRCAVHIGGVDAMRTRKRGNRSGR